MQFNGKFVNDNRRGTPGAQIRAWLALNPEYARRRARHALKRLAIQLDATLKGKNNG